MKRQNLRLSILLISFLLFPITIFYFSPVLIIYGASLGIATGSFVVFITMLVTALFFGRSFCGWLCPAGGLQECCFNAVNKKARAGKYDLIKYIIWIPWIASIILIAYRAGGINKVDFFLQIENGISVTQPASYIVYYFFVGLIVILALKAGKRAFCHYVCWMAPFMIIGAKLSNIIKLPILHLKSDYNKCTKCGVCSTGCPMSLDVVGMVERDTMQNVECILCGQCIDKCVKGVLRYQFGFVDKGHTFNENNSISDKL